MCLHTILFAFYFLFALPQQPLLAHGKMPRDSLRNPPASSEDTIGTWPWEKLSVSIWIAEPPPSDQEKKTKWRWRVVKESFMEWRQHLPFTFFFTDSSRAEIKVYWTERFDEPISGKVVWGRRNQDLVSAHIVIAFRSHTGYELSEEETRTVALHEIGHAVGLSHTDEPTSVMRTPIITRKLGAHDLAQVRSLYSNRDRRNSLASNPATRR